MAVRAGNTGERRNSLPVSDDEDGSQHERSTDDAQYDANTDNEQHPAYSYHDNDSSLVIAEKTRVSDLVTLQSPNVGGAENTEPENVRYEVGEPNCIPYINERPICRR